MSDKDNATDQQQSNQPSGEDLVKQGQAAAAAAQAKAELEEAAEWEAEMKRKLRDAGKILGVTFSPNEGIPSMREKLAAAREAIMSETDLSGLEQAQAVVDPSMEAAAARRQLRLENTKLVRVQIACLNPAKAGLPGEIFTVHNDVVGTVKKYVPYDEAGEAYHIPMFLLKFLKRRKYLQIKSPPKGSRAAPTTKMVPEFSITILEQLNEAELRELARAQGAAEAAETE